MTCWVKHSEVVGGDRASISCPSAGLAGGLCTGEWPPKPSHPRSKKAGHRKKAGSVARAMRSFCVFPYQSNATRGQSWRAD